MVEPAAKMRNKLAQFLYGLFSLGWTGSNRHWRNYEKAYLLLAVSPRRWFCLCTRSCLSTSPCRSCPVGIRRFSGRTVRVPCSAADGDDADDPAGFLVQGSGRDRDIRHLEVMSAVIRDWFDRWLRLRMDFIAYYGGNPYELYAFKNRAFGDMNWSYWWMIGSNVLRLSSSGLSGVVPHRGSFGLSVASEHWHVDGTLCDRGDFAHNDFMPGN